MSELRQYDPIKVVGSWVGPFGSIDILDGVINQGDFATVTKDNPVWSRESDRGGNSTRVKNNNAGGGVTITFSASSPTNAKLTAIVAADGVTENMVGVLTLKDLNGTTVVDLEAAFLIDTPDPSFGSDRGTRAWTWEAAAVRKVIGGHDLA